MNDPQDTPQDPAAEGERVGHFQSRQRTSPLPPALIARLLSTLPASTSSAPDPGPLPRSKGSARLKARR